MIFTNLLIPTAMGFSILLSLATAGVIVERKLPNNLESPMKGYGLAEPVLSGSILGQDFNLSGSVQEVYAQLEHIHGASQLSAAITAAKTANGDTTSAHAPRDVSDLDKRNKLPPPQCLPIGNFDWRNAEVSAIDDNARRLRDVGGRYYIPAHYCGRITCQRATSVWLCNQRDEGIAPANIYIASYVDDIKNHCQKYEWPEAWIGLLVSGGQLYE